jgi:hypothetical protein
MIDSR